VDAYATWQYSASQASQFAEQEAQLAEWVATLHSSSVRALASMVHLELACRNSRNFEKKRKNKKGGEKNEKERKTNKQDGENFTN